MSIIPIPYNCGAQAIKDGIKHIPKTDDDNVDRVKNKTSVL